MPDVVHAMRPTLLGLWARRFARARKARFVLSMHEIVEQLPDATLLGRALRGLAAWWFRLNYDAADTCVTPARFVTGHARRTLGLQHEPVYLSNALDVVAWQQAAAMAGVQEARRREANHVRLCSVINFSPYKNPMMMPELIARLVARGVDVTLEIAGGGVLHDELQARIEALGVGDRVRLLGPLERAAVARLIASNDAFLLTSLFELQPMVLIEAKALGTPALVARAALSGAVDLIEDGVDGVLFDLEIEQAVAQLEPVLRDPARLRAMREPTLVRASRFDLGAVAAQALEVYFGSTPR
jgi:glycosyltransferase involved in cell wall biosynthesis